MVPRPLTDDGLFEVDATWGTVQPIEIAPGVRTVGELEVIEHMRAGLAVFDTRGPDVYRRRSIPGAVNIPHGDAVQRIDELDRRAPAVLFCNGPQCGATPDAIRSLLAAGHPADALLYYRGGLRDWMTLGFPTVGESG